MLVLFLLHLQSRQTDSFMDSSIPSWAEDADWSSFSCYAHQIPMLSDCSRNPGICRAILLYLFWPIAVHTGDCSLEPHSPRNGRSDIRMGVHNCIQKKLSPLLLHDPWGRNLTIPGSSEWVCGILKNVQEKDRWYTGKSLHIEITQKPNKVYQYLVKYF